MRMKSETMWYLLNLEVRTNLQFLRTKIKRKLQIWLLRLKINQLCYTEWVQIMQWTTPKSAIIFCKKSDSK